MVQVLASVFRFKFGFNFGAYSSHSIENDPVLSIIETLEF